MAIASSPFMCWPRGGGGVREREREGGGGGSGRDKRKREREGRGTRAVSWGVEGWMRQCV